MNYLLDTDSIVDYFNNQRGMLALMPSLLLSGIAVSILTFIEFWDGVFRGRNRQAAARQLQTFLQGPVLLPITRRIAFRTARLRADLRSQGQHVQHRAFDLVVAATALEHGLTLVTSNTKDYDDIPGLSLLNPRTT